MRIDIQKIVYPGRRLGLAEGKVVFTDRGLPGESVEVEVSLEDAGQVLQFRGALVEVVRPHQRWGEQGHRRGQEDDDGGIPREEPEEQRPFHRMKGYYRQNQGGCIMGK